MRGCSKVRFTDCPKSADILTLHYNVCMMDGVKKTTVVQINLTRSVEKAKKWEHDGDFYLQLALQRFCRS